MLALAHQAQCGLLHKTVVWAYILSMNGITAELDARIGPSGAWRPATQTVAWAHILSMNEITAELDARIGPSGAWRAAAQGYRVGLHTFNEQDHYRAKCSHWPIGIMAAYCTRLLCGPTCFQ